MSLMSADMPCILASGVWWSRSKRGSVVAERILYGVIKGFSHGYVVWVGQFVKRQMSDGRAWDYLPVAFQYFVVQGGSHINSRSYPTSHLKLSLRESGLRVIKHNPFIKFKFAYVTDVNIHAMHFGFRGLVVKVKTG